MNFPEKLWLTVHLKNKVQGSLFKCASLPLVLDCPISGCGVVAGPAWLSTSLWKSSLPIAYYRRESNLGRDVLFPVCRSCKVSCVFHLSVWNRPKLFWTSFLNLQCRNSSHFFLFHHNIFWGIKLYYASKCLDRCQHRWLELALGMIYSLVYSSC